MLSVLILPPELFQLGKRQRRAVGGGQDEQCYHWEALPERFSGGKSSFRVIFSHPQEAGDPSTWKETPVPLGSPELWVMERQ